MAASRSSRVTRSSVGLNGLDENFCGRTLRNRSIAQPEESPVSSPPPRARSPKKRQDKQEGKTDAKTQEESKPEARSDAKPDIERDAEESDKVADSNSSSEGEQWSASRKRAASSLEKDSDTNNKSENCEKAASHENSPQIKRARKCSRSADTQGHDEEQTVPKVKENITETNADSNGEDLSISDSSKDVIKELQEEETRDGQVECDGANTNSYKASNGLKNQDETSTESSTNCLLNGAQSSGETAISTAPSPDHSVPCSNSNMESQNQIEEFIVAKEQEVSEVEEVDVLSDHLCLAREEQVVESNGQTSLMPPRQDISSPVMNNSPIINHSNSGEATPSPSPPPEPIECNATFSELYEHRYTLRTPPKKAPANGGKLSPSLPSCPSPPVIDNGPTTEIREEGEVVVEDVPMAENTEEICELGASEETQDGMSGGETTEDLTTKQEKCTEELVLKTTTAAAAAVEEEEYEEEEEPDVYYFESDHLALKHNKDYQRLLQTIGVLEAQRTQAIVDLETLSRHQRDALHDPISFVEQLQKQVNLGLPCPQRVVQLPDISWEQYTSGLGDFEREFCDKKRKTRRLKLIFDKGLPLRPKSPVEPKKEGECSSMYSPLPTSDGPENSRQTQMIRGRICHPNKPDTFNQLWTVEEQKKLEQLLMKFPPEEVESRRWQKIADELGNRTAKQVASRVQKYFIKLTKAGIPVPGRIPNLCMYTKKASTKRQHHLNKHLYRPSTFMTSYEPPVYMDEEDERASYYSSAQDPAAEESDEEVPLELRSLPEYKELLELKRLKKQKLQEIQEEKTNVRHIGFKCDVCGTEPIQGVRWHCQDCPRDNAVDFCSNCSDCLYKTDTHKPSHHLEPVYRPETFLDRDYCLPPSATGYNYLDPNYFPANR
ncbi:ZZ-type zinc finger-containing protein 3 [Periophthalmus magnuspinnatus]|uniref:ZZ-type zinc finger-containing protein 3 n=1 Tax=Periophthalmus magnuspinnatus TaxID=409849 RepID=UPI00145A92D8|nr:ZZ-type zinc finger-containing protein 3 [Periophthalmus magnuspinnatus]XP_055084272.1 ZZ-type zinc finger-containing protein 3 [Periophthalmus magnuspinnatus]